MSDENNLFNPYEGEVYESAYISSNSNVNMPYQQPVENKGIDNSRPPIDASMTQTKVFMRDIDISCDDHRKNQNANAIAIRFCKKCKVLCCDECIIDYHIDHIHEAKMKITEYFSIKRKELEDIKKTNYAHIQHKKFLEEVDEKKDQLIKKANNFFIRKSNEIDNIKAKLDTIKEEQKQIKEKTITNIKTFFVEECYNRMERPLTNLEKCKF